MYLGGVKQVHIAAILGVSKQRVRQMIQEAAHPVNSHAMLWTDALLGKSTVSELFR